MNTYETNDLAKDYKSLLTEVVKWGDEVSPRGKKTKELLNFHLTLTDPTRALVRGCNRKISVPVAAAEALQLVGGFSDPASMLQVSPHFSVFLDGGVFHAPYGPRIAPQMPKVLGRLGRDPDTRQAHVAVWDVVQDLYTDNTRDYPCTTALQFMIRGDKLDLHVHMRANDAWRGFPYDVFQFTQLQLAAANFLCREPGNYYHNATSFHLYEDNWEMVDGLTSSYQPALSGVDAFDAVIWGDVQDRERQLFYGSANYPVGGEEVMTNALRRRGVEGAW